MTDNALFRRLVLAVVAIWASTFALVFLSLPSWPDRGQFGDLFGSVNSLFSGLAFAALFFTLRLQQRQLTKQEEQLELQREELKLQRQEMAASRGELANQVKAQHALIRVAAVNAQIEMYKMKAGTVEPLGRQDDIKAIENAATALAQLAEGLERSREDG